MQLQDYFNQELLGEFAKAVPNLRSQLGQRSPDDCGSNYGVGGNTFRALVGYKHSPSSVYRQWAEGQWTRIDAAFIEERTESRDAFLGWHLALSADMDRHWCRAMGKPLPFAHCRKLVDLFIKWLSYFDFGSRSTDLLVRHANCALDKQTLRKLNECLSNALPISNPSMGDVQCEATYRFCQSAITEISLCAGGSRLLFDYFAWKSRRAALASGCKA